MLDLDGSLTGLGPNSWLTATWNHNLQPECVNHSADLDGIACPADRQVRRIVFHNFKPDSLNSKDMFVIRWDDDIVGSMDDTQKQDYINNN